MSAAEDSAEPEPSADAWNEWLDAHAEWRRAAADLVHGRTKQLRPSPQPPSGPVPTGDVSLSLRIAAAANELSQLRDHAAHRISGELHAALAYRAGSL